MCVCGEGGGCGCGCVSGSGLSRFQDSALAGSRAESFNEKSLFTEDRVRHTHTQVRDLYGLMETKHTQCYTLILINPPTHPHTLTSAVMGFGRFSL